MIRTIIWHLFFWLYLAVSICFFIPYFIFYFLRLEGALKNYIHFLSKNWSKIILQLAGTKVTIKGLKNIPQENNICFIANHQGGFDIPLIMGYIPKTINFIAKKELLYIPILGIWIKAIKCIFIDRSNHRKTVKTIQKGVEQIKKGYPLVIFPEGTRSKSSTMAKFKGGSLKLATRSNSIIVPITIDGSYRILEENKGKISPASVRLTIHPAIDTNNLSDEEKKNLVEELWDIINSAIIKH